MNNKNSEINFLRNLGIDDGKSRVIEFLVKNEQLNEFKETEHFYYWFYKEESVLKDKYEFLKLKSKKDNSFNIELDGKEFDLNTFDGIASCIVHVKDLERLSNIFNNNFNFNKTEYFLRYSKAYKRLEYYCSSSGIETLRKRNVCLIKHRKYKFFSINEKNYVLVYLNNNNPRYISNKNVIFFKPIQKYNHRNNCINYQEHENYVFDLNRLLLSVHQKNNIFSSNNFLKMMLDMKDVPNKIMLNVKNFDDLLLRVTKNKKVPKILLDKFPKSELVYLFNIIDFDEVDKIIKFIYENIVIYDHNNSLNIINSNNSHSESNIRKVLVDYLLAKFNFIIPDYTIKQFVDPKGNGLIHSNHIYVHDYLRMCESQRKKVNLKMKSLNRLIQEHDRLSLNLSAKNIPEIKVHKKYPNIQSEGNFSVEKILDKNRLLLESQLQKHCVKSYYNSINSGTCCIYSFNDNNDKKRYTLEIHKRYTLSGELIFILNQIKGKFNCNPSPETLFEIFGILSRNQIFPNYEIAIKEKGNSLFLQKRDIINKKTSKTHHTSFGEDLPF